MALDFYLVDESLCDPYILDLINESEDWFLGERDLGLELGPYDRLEVWWRFLETQGVDAGFFNDFYIAPNIVYKAKVEIGKLWGQIALTRPFYHPDDEFDPYIVMVRFLDRAVETRSGIVAFCD